MVMIRKLRIYLETSVISHLDAPDRADRMAETRRLWQAVLADQYDVVIGETVYDELDRCGEPKRTFMIDQLKTIKFARVGQTDDAERLANEYIRIGGLKAKSATDAMHIALATLAHCGFVVSWNCRHIVTANAMTAVDTVNFREGYGLIKLVTPTILMGGLEDGI